MWITRLLSSNLPGQCAVCHGWGATRVCARCRQGFVRSLPRCQRCALVVPPGVRECGKCLASPPPFGRAITAVDYVFPWDALILRLKFNAGLELAEVLSGLMIDACRAHGRPLPDLLLPMPLSSARMRSRGFNQSWELTRRVGPALHVQTAAHLLTRVIDTPHQLAFPVEQRVSNVKGAFAIKARRHHEVGGRHVAVIDDVMTTGATGAEAARVLKQAGATRVDLWVVARTPRTASG